MRSFKLKNSILNFKLLNPEFISFLELKESFEKLLEKNNYTFIPVNLPKGAKLHRIRINYDNRDFQNLSELWCPPLDKTQLGRCNNFNEQILYMSGGGHTALNELHPKENDIVTCLECELKEDIKVVNIGAVESLQRELYFRQWKAIDSNAKIQFFKKDRKTEKHNRLLEKFIIKEFTKEVSNDKLYLYKKSAAISSLFLSAPSIQGLIYPSIKSDKKEMNYAFPIEIANKVLKPVRVDVFKMSYFPKHRKMGFQLLKGSYDDLSFDNKIDYTLKYKPIENWANK